MHSCCVVSRVGAVAVAEAELGQTPVGMLSFFYGMFALQFRNISIRIGTRENLL